MAHHVIRSLMRVGTVAVLPLVLHCSNAPEEACTPDLRSAVRVSVQDESGQPLDADSVAVSVEGRAEVPCGSSGSGTYVCWEQGGGEYVVRVQVGDLERVSSVDVDADQCHVLETQALTFAFASP